MEPIACVTVTRPWHWGLVILSDPSSSLEAVDTAQGSGPWTDGSSVVIAVRHAQDVQSQDEVAALAEATVEVRHWSAAPDVPKGAVSVFEEVLPTPTRQLSIGDADEDVVMAGLPAWLILRVTCTEGDLESPDHVWVDVWQA